VEEWSDGTIASCYGFIHDLYQEVLYHRVPAGGRARLHRRCGLCLERSYGPHADKRAAELAVHLLRGRDFGRAMRYLRLAAQQAFRRSAHPEAIVHLDLAFGALRYLPEGEERDRAELALQTMRGSS
jgi:predicted ATPase